MAALAFCLLVVATARSAHAMASYQSAYGYERTWTAALRLVRVDNGWKVTEKDEADGYLLFEYRSIENPKPTAGSIELVRGKDATSPVTVLVRIPQMPHYHEQVMLDSLSAKMRREYGDPPAQNAPPARPDAPDAGH